MRDHLLDLPSLSGRIALGAPGDYSGTGPECVRRSTRISCGSTGVGGPSFYSSTRPAHSHGNRSDRLPLTGCRSTSFRARVYAVAPAQPYPIPRHPLNGRIPGLTRPHGYCAPVGAAVALGHPTDRAGAVVVDAGPQPRAALTPHRVRDGHRAGEPSSFRAERDRLPSSSRHPGPLIGRDPAPTHCGRRAVNPGVVAFRSRRVAPRHVGQDDCPSFVVTQTLTPCGQ